MRLRRREREGGGSIVVDGQWRFEVTAVRLEGGWIVYVSEAFNLPAVEEGERECVLYGVDGLYIAEWHGVFGWPGGWRTVLEQPMRPRREAHA